MAMAGYVYCIRFNGVATSAAITLAQLRPATCAAYDILRCHISQYGTTTSLQERIQIVRKTTRATLPLFTPLKFSCSDPAALATASSCSTGTGVATNEGVDGNVLWEEGFNVLNGWTWLPTPEERISLVPGDGAIALKFPTAPTTQNWTGGIYFREWQG